MLHLVTSPFFRPTTVTPRLIAHLAAFLRASVAAGGGAAGAAGAAAAGGGGGGGPPGLGEFKATLMHVLEAISQARMGLGGAGAMMGACGA